MGVGHCMFIEEACCGVSVGEEVSLGVCIGDVDELNDGLAVSIGFELWQAIGRSVGCARDVVIAMSLSNKSIFGILVASAVSLSNVDRFGRIDSADGGIASTTHSALFVAKTWGGSLLFEKSVRVASAGILSNVSRIARVGGADDGIASTTHFTRITVARKRGSLLCEDWVSWRVGLADDGVALSMNEVVVVEAPKGVSLLLK